MHFLARRRCSVQPYRRLRWLDDRGEQAPPRYCWTTKTLPVGQWRRSLVPLIEDRHDRQRLHSALDYVSLDRIEQDLTRRRRAA